MSKAETVVSALAWLAILAAVYAYCLHRFESGRKVNLFDTPSTYSAAVRLNRIPALWIVALYLIVVVGCVLTASLWAPAWMTEPSSYAGVTVLVFAALLLAMAVLAAVTRLHNRKCAEWPKPGWYDDPHDVELMRWWNGIEWTKYTYPRASYAPDPWADASA